jgi:hypothetical protein
MARRSAGCIRRSRARASTTLAASPERYGTKCTHGSRSRRRRRGAGSPPLPGTGRRACRSSPGRPAGRSRAPRRRWRRSPRCGRACCPRGSRLRSFTPRRRTASRRRCAPRRWGRRRRCRRRRGRSASAGRAGGDLVLREGEVGPVERRHLPGAAVESWLQRASAHQRLRSRGCASRLAVAVVDDDPGAGARASSTTPTRSATGGAPGGGQSSMCVQSTSGRTSAMRCSITEIGCRMFTSSASARAAPWPARRRRCTARGSGRSRPASASGAASFAEADERERLRDALPPGVVLLDVGERAREWPRRPSSPSCQLASMTSAGSCRSASMRARTG